ncbi:MAG TPA: MFS transporter [Tepidiformaceae bacterium]|nr:MFS transporter [Tepidiformaceae bacterium]
MPFFPASATTEARRLVFARTIRGFADGLVSVTLASYLDGLGFSGFEIGAIVTATMLGSAVLTLWIGLRGGALNGRTLLIAGTALMALTGAGFAAFTEFWPLLVVGFAGTMNPSASDVSLFLPIEQSLLSERVAAKDRTSLFARYTLGGALAGAVGALAAALPGPLSRALDAPLGDVQRAVFVLYALTSVAVLLLYLPLRIQSRAAEAPRGLGESRGVVLRLSALFSLDSFGGGFAVQSLLALWLFKRFDMSVEAAGTVFFVAGILSAGSQLASPVLARRIGLIRTMVFTHLPANVFLIAAALMPTAPLAVACLLVRMALSQMDVPARQSYVMAVVPPERRTAAASITNVPRSLASAVSPLLAGAMLSTTSFGWPLVSGGGLKIVYDLLLLRQFGALHPEEES